MAKMTSRQVECYYIFVIFFANKTLSGSFRAKNRVNNGDESYDFLLCYSGSFGKFDKNVALFCINLVDTIKL